MIVVASLAVAHILACCVGNIVDRIRDARMQPDPELLLLPQNNLTLHRFVSIERKPHHPIATWMRVTTLFTYLFGIAVFALVVLIDGKWDTLRTTTSCPGWSLRSCQPLSPQLCALPAIAASRLRVGSLRSAGRRGRGCQPPTGWDLCRRDPDVCIGVIVFW